MSGGNESDYLYVTQLIDEFTAEFILADKGYDSQEIVDKILSLEAEPVIPLKSNRIEQRDFDAYI